MGVARALLPAALLLAADSASALPDFLYAWDMDQVSQPRFTEDGYESVSPCTFLAGETPSQSCMFLEEFTPDEGVVAGYLGDEQPVGDFRVDPISTTEGVDLWSDGHRSLSDAAILRVEGLSAGRYSVTVMSHFPLGTSFDSTVFEIADLEPFEIANIPNPPPGSDLFEIQSRTVFVDVDDGGAFDIRYRPGRGLNGILNGVGIVPEPGTGVLVLAGMALLSGSRRSR